MDLLRKYPTTALIIMAVCAIGLYLLYRYNPEESVWLPKCPVHALTGLNCPSCGSTRVIHHLLHGDVFTALSYNPFVLISWPLIGMIIIYAGSNNIKKLRILIYIYLMLYIIWFVMRNLLGI